MNPPRALFSRLSKCSAITLAVVAVLVASARTNAAPGPAPSAPVATVGGAPITLSTYDHWAAIARQSARPQHPSVRVIRSETMLFLISAQWIIGEAGERGVTVTPAEVVRKFNQIRRQQFRSNKEFRRFQRSSGQTVADLEFRVRLDLLSSGVREKVAAGLSPAAQQQALNTFVRDFRSKWRERTSCLPAYTATACGHPL